MFGYQRYSTNYDISFPAVITISDPAALNEKGYSFVFAIEGNLRNNEPIDEAFTSLENYNFQSSLLCNINQRNSGDITISTIDAETQSPLQDVAVTYTCGEETCPIGSTDENGKLIARFPICQNGIVSFLSLDYFAPAKYLTTSLEKEDQLPVISLYPYAEKEIEIMKLPYTPKNRQLSANPVDLEVEEQAVLTLTRIKSTGDPDVISLSDFWGDRAEPVTARLVPGTYELNINTFLHKPIIIPEETRKFKIGLFSGLFDDQEEYTIPEIKFDSNYPSGGAVLNEKSGYLTISADNLYGDNKILFYVISPPLPKKIEDLNQMNKIEQYSIRFRQSLEPGYTK